ncbi:YheC/YheD family protein [Bacillus rubiinfantis]|uniref:YheC/YheD family endospore coat-associated protein n=1 Tax=Bacillus rubiinfantis TaxID=1499680 RepID=UPI0005A97008|nr:YheC/YheD family protein [Bacillus rubiinfantis]
MKPLIGIMTAQKAKGMVAGNGRLFKDIQEKLISLGGISFVFTLEGVSDEYIDGYYYLLEKNNWLPRRFRYPDLVYNRIPFRKKEQDEQTQQFFKELNNKHIPFFNPCFINKYELYECLRDHPLLAQYLPDTLLIKASNDLLGLLKKYSLVYVKPAGAARGKGIFRLQLYPNRNIHFHSRNKQEIYESFAHFWLQWHEQLLQKPYIGQQGINSADYEGARFDFRILAHAGGNNYELTGIGIRQAQTHDITTHIPAGGKLLPYEFVKTVSHDQFIQSIITPIGESLTKQFGFFGEFSVDAGLCQQGHYYIYEVNSKPMSFDETEIETKRIDQLCRLFLELCEKKG